MKWWLSRAVPFAKRMRAGSFDDARDGEAAVLQEVADAGHRRAMVDMRSQTMARLTVAGAVQHLIEDRIELLHVTLQVGGQRNRCARLRHAAALSDRSCTIVEVVHTKVGDDQIERPIRERHRGRAAFVERDVRRVSARDLLCRSRQTRPTRDRVRGRATPIRAAPPAR